MSSTDLSSTPVRTLGMVKWFNKKQGYGFIHVLNGEQTDKDIFVHYSSIRTKDTEYKYLVQGEYVEFCIDRVVKGDHEFNATDVTGLLENPILCETRRQAILSKPIHERPDHQDSPDEEVRRSEAPTRPKTKRQPRSTPPVSTEQTPPVDAEGFKRVNAGKKRAPRPSASL